MLSRPRWRHKQCFILLVSVLLIHDLTYVAGAPSSQFGSQPPASAGPQRKQNSRFQSLGSFRVVPEIEDDDDDVSFNSFEFERQPAFSGSISRSRGGRRIPSDSSRSFGIPLSATDVGRALPGGSLPVSKPTSFGVPLSSTNLGRGSPSGLLPADKPATFGIPLSATNVRAPLPAGKPATFGIPLSDTNVRAPVPAGKPATFGIPLSATNIGAPVPAGKPATFGFPLSASNIGAPVPAGKPATFGIPLSAPLPSDSSASFGVPLSATNAGASRAAGQGLGSSADVTPTFTVIRESLEDLDAFDEDDTSFDISTNVKAHFSAPTHPSKILPSQRQRGGGVFLVDDDQFDDDVSFERFDNSFETLSLGRRFHPQGIPRRSDTTLSNISPSPKSKIVISNPFIVSPDDTSLDLDDSIEDDVVDEFVVLSPMIKAYNPEKHDERLSLSNDFLSQYNFVDVQGSTRWGFETDDQFQEHKIDESGNMEGKFGWTAPGGSQVNIKYVADDGGYRVISSTGLYTRDDDEVLRLKEKHFQEHEKARIHHKNIKEERQKFQNPLPKEPQPGVPAVGSRGGFVLVPDVEDVDDVSLAVDLESEEKLEIPTFSSEDVSPEIGVFIDTSVPRATPTEGQTKFGVPLPEPSLTVKGDQHFLSSSDEGLGVQFTGPGTSLESEETFILSSDPSVGVPLPDPFKPLRSEKTPHPPAGQDFADPIETDLPAVVSPGQGFGISLPDPSITLISKAPSPVSPLEEERVPGPDFKVAIKTQGVPLPDPSIQLTSKTPSVSLPAEGFGIPLPDIDLDSSSLESDITPVFPSGQEFGVSLPDSNVGLKADSPFLGHDFFAPSVPPSGQGTGVALPDSTLTDSPFLGHDVSAPSVPPSGQGTGVALPDSTLTDSPFLGHDVSAPRVPPSGQGTGVALPDSTLTVSSDQGVGVSIPDYDIPSVEYDTTSSQEGEVFVSDPSSSFGIPLSGAQTPPKPKIETPFADTAVPSKPSLPSETLDFGIPLAVDTKAQDVLPPSAPDFGVPLSDDVDGFQKPAFEPAAPVIKSDTKVDIGIPLSDSVPSDVFVAPSAPDFGIPLSDSDPSDVSLVPSVPDFGISLSDSSSFESEGLIPSAVPDFGIPLSETGAAPAQETDLGIPMSQPTSVLETDSSLPSRQDFGISLSEPAPSLKPISSLSPSQDFGIPLSASAPTPKDDSLLAPSSLDFGIPLSESERVPAGETDFGISLLQPGLALETDSSKPSTTQDFGIPLFGSEEVLSHETSFGISLSQPDSAHISDSSLPLSVQDFGIPLSQPAPTLEAESPLPPSRQDFGIPLVQPAPALEVESPLPPSPQDFGIPLSQPAPTLEAESPVQSSRQDFGIPLAQPAPALEVESPLPPSPQDFGIPLSHPAPSIEAERPLPPSRQDFGIPLVQPSPTLEDDSPLPPSQDVGIPLSQPAPALEVESPVQPSHQDFGIPLAQPSLFEDESPLIPSQEVGIHIPQPSPTLAGERPLPPSLQDFGIPLLKPAPALEAKRPLPPSPQDFGIPLDRPSPTLEAESPLPPSRQDFGVSLIDAAISVERLPPSQVDSVKSEQEFGISLSSPVDDISVGSPPQPVKPSQKFDHTLTGEVAPAAGQESFGVPLDSENALLPATVPQESVSGAVDFGVEIPVSKEPSRDGILVAQDISNQENVILESKVDIKSPSFKPEAPATIVISRESGQTASKTPTRFESFGVPLDVNINIPAAPAGSDSASGAKFFVVPDEDDLKIFRQNQRVPSQPSKVPSQRREKFSQAELDIPKSPVSSFILNTIQTRDEAPGVGLFDNMSPGQFQTTGVDLLQGPPVENLDPLIGSGKEPRIDPCLNGKLHPALLPAECFDRPDIKPSQKIGKSLSAASSNDEPKTDSFIVVVNSDIFQ